MYLRLTFVQGEEANEVLQILEEQGCEAAIDYLSERAATLHGDEYNELAAGEGDEVYEDKTGFILTYNYRLGYAGLEIRV